jgi:hypothetical protein
VLQFITSRRGGFAALGWRSRADVAIIAAAVLVTTIISATAGGEAAIVFGFFIVLVDIF